MYSDNKINVKNIYYFSATDNVYFFEPRELNIYKKREKYLHIFTSVSIQIHTYIYTTEILSGLYLDICEDGY